MPDGPLCACGARGCLEALAGEATGATPQQRGRWLGIALASAVNLVDPAVVVLGGFLAEQADELVPGDRGELRARVLGQRHRPARIVRGVLGREAAMRGAAELALARAARGSRQRRRVAAARTMPPCPAPPTCRSPARWPTPATPRRSSGWSTTARSGIVRQLREPEPLLRASSRAGPAGEPEYCVVLMRHLSLPPRATLAARKARPGKTRWSGRSTARSARLGGLTRCAGAGAAPVGGRLTRSRCRRASHAAAADRRLLVGEDVGAATEIGIEPTVRHGADLGLVPIVGSRRRTAPPRTMPQAGASTCCWRTASCARYVDLHRELVDRVGAPLGR